MTKESNADIFSWHEIIDHSSQRRDQHYNDQPEGFAFGVQTIPCKNVNNCPDPVYGAHCNCTEQNIICKTVVIASEKNTNDQYDKT